MFLSSPEMKAYSFFLLNVNLIFNRVNVTASPLIHKLCKTYCKLLKEILSRFLKPPVIIKNVGLLAINYHSKENQKELQAIKMGSLAKDVIRKLWNLKRGAFWNTILNYYT